MPEILPVHAGDETSLDPGMFSFPKNTGLENEIKTKRIQSSLFLPVKVLFIEINFCLKLWKNFNAPFSMFLFSLLVIISVSDPDPMF